MKKILLSLIAFGMIVFQAKPALAISSLSAQSVYTNYTNTPVDTATPLVLISSAGRPVREVHVFDSSGQSMKLHIVSGPYVTDVYMPPGGDNSSLNISQGDSISIVGVSGTASSGINILTLIY